MKQYQTIGKVALANLFGDGALLSALSAKEDDTVTAYERASRHPGAIEKSRAFFQKAHAGKLRHRKWMQRTAAAL